MPLLAMGPDGQIMFGVDPNNAAQYGGSAVWQNDDGTIWRQPDGGNDGTANYIRPDLRDAWNKENQAKQAAMLNNNPAFKQFTPEQAAAYQNYGGSAADLGAMASSWAPPNGNSGIYNDSMYGGKNLWFGPQAAPQHSDNGLGWGDIVTGGAFVPYSEKAQSGWNDMRSGLAVMAAPLAGYGITAGLGAAGAGAAGASVAEGGAAAGAGATGVDASTGLFAGESATSGAAGAGATGTVSGGAGSASLIGGAGSDTAASMPAATAEADPLGGYNIDPNTGDVFHGTGDNPFTSNFSGGTGNEGFSGYQPGVLEQAQTQAAALAKQFGLTPAAALQMALKGLGRAAPAALGAVASSKQTDQFQRLADQYASYGAPYRQRLSDLYSDPSSFLKSPEVTVPVQQASDIAAHSLSMGGNPVASGNALQQLQDYSSNQLFGRLGQEKDRLAGFGGLTAYNAAAPGAATNAINSGTNVANSIGAGISNVFNPPQTLAQQMADFQRLSGAAH